MDLYTKTAYEQSKILTKAYSTSFSMSTRLFPLSVRPHIYAIYGLVRIADEIVDTYMGADAEKLLNDLEIETYAAISRNYSVNPLVHSFAQTCTAFDIDKTIIAPFFDSMRVDIDPPAHFSEQQYTDYIHGSAEVVGLMCLHVFVAGKQSEYQRLTPGAKRLGAAYQKVNFLRDFAADYNDLGRIYFPNVPSFPLNDRQKDEIIADISDDIAAAEAYIAQLPKHIQPPVELSKRYYKDLTYKLSKSSADEISRKRIRISNARKSRHIVGGVIRANIHRGAVS